MEIRRIDLDISDLRFIFDGCPRHRFYRGGKETDCETCMKLFRLRNLLLGDRPEAIPFDPRCFYCGINATHSPEEHTRSITAAKRGTE